MNTDGLCLRRARLGDIDALAALEAHFPTDRIPRAGFRHLLTRANAHVWVCAKNGDVCADTVVLFRRQSRIARVYSIVVHPNHRGRGLARRLILAAETAAIRRGCRHMRLEVRPANTAAQSLYRLLGYTTVTKLESFYEDGGDALRMAKDLRATNTARRQPSNARPGKPATGATARPSTGASRAAT